MPVIIILVIGIGVYFYFKKKGKFSKTKAKAEVDKPTEDENEKARRIHIKVSGVTFNNEDGTSRQDFLKKAKKISDNGGEVPVRLEKYKYNDEDAVKVFINENEEIGQVDATRVKSVIKAIDSDSIAMIKPSFGSFLNDNDEVTFYCKIHITLK